MALVRAEVRRILGRRGSSWGSAIVIALFALGLLVWAVLSDKANGHNTVENGSGLLAVSVIFCSIIIGATVGSYDVDKGTMRYLVLTGVSRWKLALVRVPGFLISIVVISAPGYALVLLAAAIAGGGPAAGSGDWVDLFYAPLVGGTIYGLIGLAIGTFLRSSGVAIALAIVLNFVGAVIAALIHDHVWKPGGDYFVSNASDVVIGHLTDGTITLTAAVVTTITWLALLLAAATLRVQRAEY